MVDNNKRGGGNLDHEQNKERTPTEIEIPTDSTAEKTKRSTREIIAGLVDRGRQFLSKNLGGELNDEDLEKITTLNLVSEAQAEAAGSDFDKSIDEITEASHAEEEPPTAESAETNEKEELQQKELQENQPISIKTSNGAILEGRFKKYVTQEHLKKALIQMPDGRAGTVFLDQIESSETKAKSEQEPTEGLIESPAEEATEPKPETEQPSKEAKVFQQAKLEARFSDESEKLKAEYILENESYKKAIDEMVETILLPSGKETRQTEVAIVKKMTEAFGDYFNKTPKEQKESVSANPAEEACWEVFNAIKAHITDEAAKTESKSLTKKLITGGAKGLMYFGAGFGGTILLGPLGGILIAGGLRQADTLISHKASKKRLKEYKTAINTDKDKEQLGAVMTDLILSKKKTELLQEKLKQNETWKQDEQKEFAQRYKKNALNYLNTHQAEQIEGLSKEQIELQAESIAVYFAIDDNTEKMLKELELTQDGKENTKWKSLVNVFRKIDNTPSKKFYSAATATGIGLGIRGTVTTMGMSSKWVRRTMMTFAGYKLGGALGEMAAGKKSPEAIAKKSLENLKIIELDEVTDETIFDNYSKELSVARAAISEIPQTAKNKVQIEKWQRELESREFELLNETMIQNSEASTEKIAVTAGLIYGEAEKTAKKEITVAGKQAKAYKIAGKIGGALLGFLAADIAGAIMQKIDERMQEGESSTESAVADATEQDNTIEAEGTVAKKPEMPKEEDLEFLKEKLGPESPRPVPAFKHELSGIEMPNADYSYKGGKSIWEESENQLEELMGDKFKNLSTAEKNILIDNVKDSVVEKIGQPESSNYYNKMTENDLKAIDWEEHVKGTIKTAPRADLITPETPDSDIPEPTVQAQEVQRDLNAEAKISHSDELPENIGPIPQEADPIETSSPIDKTDLTPAEAKPYKSGAEILETSEIPPITTKPDFESTSSDFNIQETVRTPSSYTVLKEPSEPVYKMTLHGISQEIEKPEGISLEAITRNKKSFIKITNKWNETFIGEAVENQGKISILDAKGKKFDLDEINRWAGRERPLFSFGKKFESLDLPNIETTNHIDANMEEVTHIENRNNSIDQTVMKDMDHPETSHISSETEIAPDLKIAETPEIPEAPKPTVETADNLKLRTDVEKAVAESIQTKEGTKKLASLIKTEPKIDRQLTKTGINFQEWEKLSPQTLKDNLSGLTKKQQNLYKTKKFITIAKDIITREEIK